MIKNKNFLLTVVLPIVVSLIIGIAIIVFNSISILNTRATAIVLKEKNQMTSDIDSMVNQKRDLEYTSAEYDKTLSDNQALLNEIETLNASLDEITSDINKANETIAQLNTSIEEKKKYNDSLSSLSQESSGATTSYKNTKLNVPSDIPVGRYKAEGTGTVLIYSIANTLEDKQNLSLIDTHSYTFNLESGQSIKIEGTIKLTEIIQS